MRRFGIYALMLLLWGAGCGQDGTSDVAAPIAGESAADIDVEKTVDAPDIEQADALTMFQAADKAFAAGRIEDAGFLFYAAQFRRRVDVRVYVPIGTGGNSPDLALGAVRQQIGRYVNPAIIRDRDAYARVIDRLAEWTPSYDVDYSPGWEYKGEPSEAEFVTALAEWKARNIEPMRGLAGLMANDEYYRLFCTAQDYNLKGTDVLEKAAANLNVPQPDPAVTEKSHEAAVARLAQIEEESGGGFGVFSEKLRPKPERPPLYVIQDGQVLHEGQVLPGADAASFEILAPRGFAKDRERVFLYGRALVGADPATSRVLEGAYCRDASHVYCGTVRMDVTGADAFEVVEASDFWHQVPDKDWFISLYGKSVAHVEVSEQHPAITADAWGRDGVSYYFGPGRVEGADYHSFEVIDEFNARDKNREYHGAHPTPDTTQ